MTPRGLLAGSYWTRLLRVVASFVATVARPPCTCPNDRPPPPHASDCHRWLHLRIVALLQGHDITPYDTANGLGQALNALEDGRGTAGGAEATWKGGGMDPVFDRWLEVQLRRTYARMATAEAHGDATTAHRSRIKCLKQTRAAVRRYAARGTMIVDMTTEEG